MSKTCYHLPVIMTPQHRECMPLDNTLLVSKKYMQQQRWWLHAKRTCTTLRPTNSIVVQLIKHKKLPGQCKCIN